MSLFFILGAKNPPDKMKIFELFFYLLKRVASMTTSLFGKMNA